MPTTLAKKIFTICCWQGFVYYVYIDDVLLFVEWQLLDYANGDDLATSAGSESKTTPLPLAVRLFTNLLQ